MSVRVTASASATAELEAAVRWYEAQREGLGADFFDAVLECVNRIATHPEAGSEAFGPLDVRRALVKRFPYQVVYRFRERELQILAFAHLKRSPDFWKDRI